MTVFSFNRWGEGGSTYTPDVSFYHAYLQISGLFRGIENLNFFFLNSIPIVRVKVCWWEKIKKFHFSLVVAVLEVVIFYCPPSRSINSWSSLVSTISGHYICSRGISILVEMSSLSHLQNTCESPMWPWNEHWQPVKFDVFWVCSATDIFVVRPLICISYEVWWFLNIEICQRCSSACHRWSLRFLLHPRNWLQWTGENTQNVIGQMFLIRSKQAQNLILHCRSDDSIQTNYISDRLDLSR